MERDVVYYLSLMQQYVTLDDSKIHYRVTGILWRGIMQVELSWVNDLEPKSCWVEGWRVNKA